MQKKSLTWFWLLLFLGVVYRLSGNLWPAFAPNLSPLMAFAVLGAVYLPRIWSLFLVPLILLITELAFLPLNQASDGQAISAWFFIAIFYYVVVSFSASFLESHRSWLNFLGGTVLGSIGFYLLSNTFSWGAYLAHGTVPGYAPTFTGWVQANTTGLPGFPPTWMFLRNDLLADVIFVPVLLWAWERPLLGLGITEKTATRPV